jgi:hypothetical protein
MSTLDYKNSCRRFRVSIVTSALTMIFIMGSCSRSESKDKVIAGGAASGTESATTSQLPTATAFCSKVSLLRSAEDRYANASDPAGAKSAMNEVVAAIEAATVAAAAAERPSFQAMQDSLAPLTAILTERNYELTVIFADKDLSPRLAPLVRNFEAATQNVDSIGLRECGIPLPGA